jgi:hypothetical protein
MVYIQIVRALMKDPGSIWWGTLTLFEPHGIWSIQPASDGTSGKACAEQ